MRAAAFWKTVTADRSNFLDSLIAVLEAHEVPYCVIGGQGVNAYVDPLVSLDLDLVIAAHRLPEVQAVLAAQFEVGSFTNGLNISCPGSSFRVQIQTDPRYFPFVERAARHEVLGISLPVAAVDDILQGKIWAAMDAQRPPSKRRKDLLDIERLLEACPRLRERVPAEVLAKLE